MDVTVCYEDQHESLSLLVVKREGSSLFGRDWLDKIKLNWAQIKFLSRSPISSLDSVLTQHAELFNEELGLLKDVKITLHVRPDSQPKYYKSRAVPFVLKEGVEKELDRLQALGVIIKVNVSEWAAPIVPVVKNDESIRLCGDYNELVHYYI